MSYPVLDGKTARELARLRRTQALLKRRDPAGQAVAWFALGIRPSQYLTGSIDRRVFLSAAKRTEDYLEALLIEPSRSQYE